MEWIPYDGNHPLPNDKEDVLVTFKWSDGTYSVLVHDYWEIANSKDKKGFGLGDKYAVAWMPFPDPYK